MKFIKSKDNHTIIFTYLQFIFTFVNLQKVQTERNFPLLIKRKNEVKRNNTMGTFKKKMNCLSYSMR